MRLDVQTNLVNNWNGPPLLILEFVCQISLALDKQLDFENHIIYVRHLIYLMS